MVANTITAKEKLLYTSPRFVASLLNRDVLVKALVARR